MSIGPGIVLDAVIARGRVSGVTGHGRVMVTADTVKGELHVLNQSKSN